MAANAQAEDHPSASEPIETSALLARKQRSKVAVAFVMLAVFVLPVLLLLLTRAVAYLRALSGGRF